MEKYNTWMKLMHWAMAAIIVILLVVGLWMVGISSEEKAKIYPLHKSFGVVALLLILIRVIIRLCSIVPSYNGLNLNNSEVMLAHVVHIALYLMMLVMPLCGFLMSQFGGHTVVFFGTQLPMFVAPNSQLADVFHAMHVYAGYLITTLIGLHLLGNAKHFIFDKVNLMKRM